MGVKSLVVKKAIHVVAAVIVGSDGNILIAKRLADAHQGGLWEFPGGKVEPGELPEDALVRELQEELGITATSSRPLIQIHHDYPDKSVFLDVWKVTEFDGDPLGGAEGVGGNDIESRGLEGQLVQWVPVTELHQWQFPAANIPIVQAAQLPVDYVITPDLSVSDNDLSIESDEAQLFLNRIERVLKQGRRLIQLRTKSLPEKLQAELNQRVQALCESYGAILMLNSDLASAYECVAENVGLHLSEKGLRALKEKPKGYRFVAASCHDEGSVRIAESLGLDFVTLSPVAFTLSHPKAEPLGWDFFAALVREARVPVYALGGVKRGDKQQAIRIGAQGIASISAYE